MAHRVPLLARNTLWYLAITFGFGGLFILVGALVPCFLANRQKVALVSTLGSEFCFSGALQAYQKDCVAWPPNLDALTADPGVQGWRGPYYQGSMADGWRTPFRYRLVNGLPELASAGPDRQFGTADDIVQLVAPEPQGAAGQ